MIWILCLSYDNSLSMGKLVVRRCLNFLLWICVCVLTGTGSVLAWKFPHGPQGGVAYTLLGMDKHFWKDAHLWVGVAFAGLVIAHLYMAWPWLKSAAAGRKRLWAVILGILAGLSIPLLMWASPVQSRTVDDSTTVSVKAGFQGKGSGNGYGKGKSQWD
jgi:hypothetical protein